MADTITLDLNIKQKRWVNAAIAMLSLSYKALGFMPEGWRTIILAPAVEFVANHGFEYE